MTNTILGIVRMILLLLVIAFVALFGYKYYTLGELNYSYLTPILGLLVFYFITKPKTK
jgi:hypothetical protein